MVQNDDLAVVSHGSGLLPVFFELIDHIDAALVASPLKLSREESLDKIAGQPESDDPFPEAQDIRVVLGLAKTGTEGIGAAAARTPDLVRNKIDMPRPVPQT
jgi:hypothetical protein